MTTTAKISGSTHRMIWHTDHEHARKLAAYCTICGWHTDNAGRRQLVARFTSAHQPTT